MKRRKKRKPKVDSHRNIIVEASDEVLLHWTTNALNRHGYACSSAFTAGTADLPRLQVLSAEDFRLHKEKEYTFCSFEQLLANI